MASYFGQIDFTILSRLWRDHKELFKMVDFKDGKHALLNVNFNERQQPDDYGNTHYLQAAVRKDDAAKVLTTTSAPTSSPPRFSSSHSPSSHNPSRHHPRTTSHSDFRGVSVRYTPSTKNQILWKKTGNHSYSTRIGTLLSKSKVQNCALKYTMP